MPLFTPQWLSLHARYTHTSQGVQDDGRCLILSTWLDVTFGDPSGNGSSWKVLRKIGGWRVRPAMCLERPPGNIWHIKEFIELENRCVSGGPGNGSVRRPPHRALTNSSVFVEYLFYLSFLFLQRECWRPPRRDCHSF